MAHTDDGPTTTRSSTPPRRFPPLHPPALAPDIAVRAGLLRARHCHRRDRALSLAGCAAAATAQALDAPLATSDPHLLDTCAVEGITVVALPDARGVVWAEGTRGQSRHQPRTPK